MSDEIAVKVGTLVATSFPNPQELRATWKSLGCFVWVRIRLDKEPREVVGGLAILRRQRGSDIKIHVEAWSTSGRLAKNDSHQMMSSQWP